MGDITTINEYLEIDPRRRRGAVTIRGHRLTVADLVTMHQRLGKSPDQIAGDFELSLAAVHAALAYYFGHRQEIDQQIESDESFAEAFERESSSPLAKKLRDLRAAS
ncbi:MAG: DUF433 domain-containing protein [Acidobacteriota bacterium]